MGAASGFVMFLILVGLAFAYVEMTRTPDPSEKKPEGEAKPQS